MPHGSITVGEIRVTCLCDGWAPLPLADECPGRTVDWDEERSRFPWAFAPSDSSSWAWHVHAFLVRGHEGAVLVDTGIGHLGTPPYDVEGRIEEELATAGSDPSEIEHVVHTHLHADHAGGSCRPDGGPRFPEAVHHVHPADWEFFAGATDSEDFSGRAAMAEIENQGRLDLRPEPGEVARGVHVLHAPGHTPGHRSVLLVDGAASLLLTGDLLHTPPQVRRPGWASNHDEDPGLASEQRTRLLARAHEERWEVGVSHFAEPFGAVIETGWASHPLDA